MSRQASFADLDYTRKKRQTRREVFLKEMEVVVPWSALLSRIEPHYPKSGRRGRQPMALGSMLRIYCMQNWFNLSDRQMEDALYEIESMRRFAGFSGVTDALPDETTILNFRHLLEKHNLTAVLLDEINARLKNEGLLVSRGTMVDASIIHAPSSTKNQGQSRDPQMHQTRKGKPVVFWHEDAHWGGCGFRGCAQHRSHCRQRGRHQRSAQAAAGARRSHLWRCRLYQ